MTRPKSKRCISHTPCICYFKPAGISGKKHDEVILLPEELEALRMSDAEGLNQTDAAKKMQVSQPTFARIIAVARHKVAIALVRGWAIRIHNDDDKITDNPD